MKRKAIRAAEILIHLLAVLFIVLYAKNSYELISYFENETKYIGFVILTNTYQLFWHLVVFGLYVTYWFVFYYGIYSRFPSNLRKKIIAGISGWASISALHTLILYIFSHFLYSEPILASVIFKFDLFRPLEDSLFSFMLMIAVIAFLAHTSMQFMYHYNELEEADRRQTELSLIRSQLRPHFFFNTLNNLYSIALQSRNESLADGIQNLTGMMRYSLEQASQNTVPLEEEWKYINRYIELQRLRYTDDDINITVKQEGSMKGIQVAPMIMINFVENSFKHGVSYEGPSYVDIHLKAGGDSVELKVKNSNHPSMRDRGRSGIGTKQSVKLLRCMYGNRFELHTEKDTEYYRIHLIVPSEL